MRYPASVGVVLFAMWSAVSAPLAQAPQPSPLTPDVFPVPAGIRAEGLPPIPSSIPGKIDPYGSFTSATLLGWHPTARRLLIQTRAGTREQVHVAPAPGAPLLQVTSVAGGVTGGATYEPVAGGYVLYRKVAGQETSQLFRYDVESGNTTTVTDGQSRDGVPVWSHRGHAIAFESSRRNKADRDIYVMNPASPTSLRMVMQVEGPWSLEAWSPDDRTLLAVQTKSSTESYLWRVDVETGAKTLLTPGEPSAWNWPQYSPDGRAIFAVSNRGSELARVWRMDVATGAWAPVTRDGDSVETCVVSPDGRRLAVVFDRDASSRLELLDAKTLRLAASPRVPTGVILGVPQWSATSTDVAFTLRSVASFGDVYSVRVATGAVERWTTSASGPIGPGSLPDAEIVRWKSFDNRMISGVLYRPATRFTGPRPVIINIHGGPDGIRERPRFQGRSAYFLNELGIAIVYPNVRGSSGFGKTFETLDDGLKREDTVKDIGALLDWIATQPALDKDRVLVTGASYGGYMTYAVAEAYPGRIRAAYAAAAISNFITYFEQTDPARLVSRRAEYGDERDPVVRDFLTRISPVTQASKVRTPLLIAQGKLDSRVPIGQAEEMYRAAKANGAPVWLVVYEDDGHDFPSNAKNNNFHFYTWILFVQTYLLN